MPITTVHPYDGPATVAERERVAAKGIKALKLHPHTQKFDPDDLRVLTLVRRAGELGVIALIDNANCLAIARSCSTLRSRLPKPNSSSRISAR